MSHPARKTAYGCVIPLILSEVVGFKGSSQGERLAEAEGEALAGDGVDGPGGVADECDAAARDPMKSAAESDGAAGCVAGWSGGEAALKLREVTQGLIDVGVPSAGDEGYAHLIGGYGSDISLAVVAPVNLDMVGPGGEGEVLAEADATRRGDGSVEASPGADAGLVAVGSHDEAGGDGAAIGADGLRQAGSGDVDSLHHCLPMEADA
jgi:hypothetical protein